jgi:hypothetical protein
LQDAQTIYEALLFLLAKQQVPLDTDSVLNQTRYTQVSNENARMVLVHNLDTNNKFIYLLSDVEKYHLPMERLLDTNETATKIWDFLNLLGIKQYAFNLLQTHGIPNQTNISEQELKEARLR